jgi:hypothetical protein
MPSASSTSQSRSEAAPGSGRHPRRHIGAQRIHRDPTRRAAFNSYGCTVYGWPSKGGIIIRTCADAVELEYLGFDKFDPPAKRFADQDEEDKFCTTLLKIGGKWWSSEQRLFDINDVYMLDRMEDQPTDDELKDIFVGWPADGGVLIVEYQSEVGDEKVPRDIGRLRMASTMHERCEMLRNRFGAKFYHDWRVYGGFAELDT